MCVLLKVWLLCISTSCILTSAHTDIDVRSNPCVYFLQVCLAVKQSVLQPHRIMSKSSLGAANRSVNMGSRCLSHSFHHQSSGSKSTAPAYPFHWCAWWYTHRLWYFAAADVGGRTMSLYMFGAISHVVTKYCVPKLIKRIAFLSTVQTNTQVLFHLLLQYHFSKLLPGWTL